MINKLKAKLFSDTHLTELLKGSSIAFIFRIVGMGLGYVLTLMITRWYGADTMGLFSLSITLLNIFTTISVFGFNDALVRFVADYNSNNKPHLVKDVYQKSLSTTIILSFILSVILYFSSPFFSEIVFKNKELKFYFQIISFGVTPFVLININSAFFRGLKKINFFSFFKNVGVFLMTAIILFVASTNKYHNSITVISQVLALYFIMIMSFVVIVKYTGIAKYKSKNILGYMDLLKVSFPMLFSSSMAFVMGWADIIMIGIFRNEGEVGVYSVVVKLALLTTIPLIAVSSISSSQFSEYFSQRKWDLLKKSIFNSTKLILVTTAPIIFILALFSKEFLLSFGDEFVEGLYALLFLFLGRIFDAVTGISNLLLSMIGLQNQLMINMMIATFVNIILNYLLVPMYGINGAGISTSISIIFLNVLSVFIAVRFLRKKENELNNI